MKFKTCENNIYKFRIRVRLVAVHTIGIINNSIDLQAEQQNPTDSHTARTEKNRRKNGDKRASVPAHTQQLN